MRIIGASIPSTLRLLTDTATGYADIQKCSGVDKLRELLQNCCIWAGTKVYAISICHRAHISAWEPIIFFSVQNFSQAHIRRVIHARYAKYFSRGGRKYRRVVLSSHNFCGKDEKLENDNLLVEEESVQPAHLSQ